MTRRASLLAAAALLAAFAGTAARASDRDDVGRWIHKLRTGDFEEREAATDALVQLALSGIDPDTRAALEKLLADPDPEVRFRARWVLGVPDARIERLVIDAASVEKAQASESSRRTLQGLPKEANAPSALARIARRYASGSSAEDKRRLRVLLDLLSEVAGPDEVDSAVELLRWDVGKDTAWDVALVGARKPDVARAALRRLLRDSSAPVRERAVQAYGELGDASDLPALLQLVQDPSPDVRRALVQTLEIMPLAPDAVAPAGVLAADDDASVAQAGLELCASFKLRLGIDAARKIIGRADAPRELRACAVRTLGELGDAGAGDALAGLIDSSDADLARSAAWGLGASGSPAALPALERAIAARPSWREHEAVLFALSRAGGLAKILELSANHNPKPIQTLSKCPAAGTMEELTRLGRDAFGKFIRTGDGGARLLLKNVLRALRDRDDDEARDAVAAILAARPDDRGIQASRRDDLLADVGVARAVRELCVTKLASDYERLLKNARQVDRRQPVSDVLAIIDPDRARRAIDEVLRTENPSDSALVDLARALARAGDRSRAERALEISRGELDRKFTQGRVEPAEIEVWLHFMNMVGIDQLYSAKFEDAVVTFRRMLWARPENNVAAYNVACGLALSGKNEDALRWLRRSIRMSNPNFEDWRHISTDRDLVSLFGDARFKRLMRALRLEQERRPFPSLDE